MSKEITLQSIIDKVGCREFFYQEPERVKIEARAYLSMITGQVEGFLTDRESQEQTLIQNYLEGFISDYEFFNKFNFKENEIIQAQNYKYKYQNSNDVLEKFCVTLTPKKLEVLDYNASYLKFVVAWLRQNPSNGKRNFYTILRSHTSNVSKSAILKQFTKKRYLVANGKKRKLLKPELFKLVKRSIILYLSKKINGHFSAPIDKRGRRLNPEVRGDLGAYEQFIERLKKLLAEIKTLEYKEISDRHTPVKREIIYRQYDNIAPLAHSQTLDFVSVLAKVSTQEDKYLGKKIILWENDYLTATTWLPIEAKTVPNFGVFVDKLLTECRLKAYDTYNVNVTDKELTISYPIHEAMLQFGYAENKEQAEDSEIRKNFMKEFKGACQLLSNTEIEEKHGKKTKFKLVAKYTQEQVMLITFTSNFQQMVVASNDGHYAEEHVLRSLARRIPNRKPTEYYLARYLVSIATNKNNIAKGREDRLSLKSIIEHLEACNVLYSGDTTRNAQRRKVDRLLEAFKWLSDNKIIDSYFYDNKDEKKMPVELSSNSYYLNNIQTLEELSSWYVVPELETFIDEHREEYAAKLIAGQEKAKQAKKRKEKKAESTSKEKEAEQEEDKSYLKGWL